MNDFVLMIKQYNYSVLKKFFTRDDMTLFLPKQWSNEKNVGKNGFCNKCVNEYDFQPLVTF